MHSGLPFSAWQLSGLEEEGAGGAPVPLILGDCSVCALQYPDCAVFHHRETSMHYKLHYHQPRAVRPSQRGSPLHVQIARIPVKVFTLPSILSV